RQALLCQSLSLASSPGSNVFPFFISAPESFNSPGSVPYPEIPLQNGKYLTHNGFVSVIANGRDNLSPLGD
ncbi:hypothetical protein NEM59_27995, partial [Escherichia coli]|nr:hypothetical protein [Escherichia coli]